MILAKFKDHIFSVAGIVLAVLLYGFSIYYGLELYKAKVGVFKALEAYQADELFFPLMIVAIGVFIDALLRRRRACLREEKLKVVQGVMTNVDHLLRNLLNNLYYFRDELESAKDVSPETVKLFDLAIKDATDELDKLALVQDIPASPEEGIIKNKTG